jgi:hypothetical protein
MNLATLFAIAVLVLSSLAQAQKTAQETPEVIVITGRLPGPPLWKVSNGDKVLWIFPHLEWIPRDMEWDSERVARVIAQSQEVLSLPEASWVPPTSVLRNPLNLARSIRRSQGTDRNPDGGTLQENLPPQLYARFAPLKARYFPANDEPLQMRPLFAGRTMMNIIRKREGLVADDDILKTIQRLVRRNRDIKRTEIAERLELGGDFDDYTNRIDAVYKSFPPAQEQACFEQQLHHIEEDLGKLKSRANAWAQGYLDEFRSVDELHNVSRWAFDDLNACADLFRGSSSPAHDALTGMAQRINQRWLDVAETALATNASTFAILPINELLAEDGLLSRLKTKGYEVREP